MEMSSNLFLRLFLFMFLLNTTIALEVDFYNKACPQVENIIKATLKTKFNEDPTLPASLVRLHFHDCFVQGCDASILLDDSEKVSSEKNALPNKNSLRGYEVIDEMKSQLEQVCPETVSCADILALSARDSIEQIRFSTGGPSWKVLMGRKDSVGANFNGVSEALPSPGFNLQKLEEFFLVKGLGTSDLVALSGAHTLGVARCRFSIGLGITIHV
ncbi:hypothetical protein AQUCO_00700293v1 [Aquilegia coerulea]|uniref:peroxidase n=1 Tax=Aquilegia coerulea TaxID=218851 RepID=A0A2G5EJE2_AQUCA|nr:hypothetical protein AQUCO_00700293v1 [Aquilegia coerulea]